MLLPGPRHRHPEDSTSGQPERSNSLITLGLVITVTMVPPGGEAGCILRLFLGPLCHLPISHLLFYYPSLPFSLDFLYLLQMPCLPSHHLPSQFSLSSSITSQCLTSYTIILEVVGLGENHAFVLLALTRTYTQVPICPPRTMVWASSAQLNTPWLWQPLS